MALRRGQTGMVGDVPTYRLDGAELPTNGVDNAREDPKLGQRPNGNRSNYTLRDLYAYWFAAYRGVVPHGVATSRLMPGAATVEAPKDDEFLNDPEGYEDGAPVTTADTDPEPPNISDMVPVPVVMVDDLTRIERRTAAFFHAYTQGVGTTVDRIIPRQDSRIDCRILNLGPGTVTIGENESRGYTGFTLPAAMTSPIVFPTTREIWAVQQTAQSGPAQVCIFLTFEGRVSE